jgi:outer membrane protein, heavy metal efflux system
MRTLIVRAAVAMAFVPVAAGAQSLSLTESEALARLSPDSPRVQAIRASVDVARADVQAAARWPNPRLVVNRESSAGITEYISTIGQVLPITGRRGLAVSAASARADGVSSRADEEIRRAFGDLVAEQSRESELRVAVARVREVAAAIAKREAAGDAAGFDRLRAEREALNVEADGSAIAVARVTARAALTAYFADPGPGEIIAVPPARTRTALPTVDELMARAETSRGELRALQQEIASAEFAEQAATRGLYPEPEVVAGAKSSSVGELGGVFAVHATLPLFDRAQPERASARARAVQARARVSAFRAALRAQLGALRTAVLEQRQAADRYRAADEANADLEQIAQVSYDAGEHGILQLLDAYRTALAARLRQIDLDQAARRAEIELEFASGWEIQSCDFHLLASSRSGRCSRSPAAATRLARQWMNCRRSM